MSYLLASMQSDLDVIAKIYDLLATALGDGSGATSVSARAASVENRVLAAADYDVATKMLPGVHTFAQRCLTAPTLTTIVPTIGAMTAEYWTALRNYLGDLRTGLNALDLRMHPSAALAYAAANQGTRPHPSTVFPLATTLGTVARAAGTWTFTDGSAIDDTLYSGAQLKIRAGGLIGAADCVLTISAKQTSDGAASQFVVTMPSGSTEGTEVSCGDTEYVNVTTVTVTGGTNGDSISIVSVQERNPLA